MKYMPFSPFKRPISLADLEPEDRIHPSSRVPATNKWEALRELCKAKSAFGVSERDLSVLQALLSFYPSDTLDADAEMVVYPSNRAICDRLNGMPCSTMRRHLASLVQSGFLIRRDSPNGKRYCRRLGDQKIAFGFDISPLHSRYGEIIEAADQVRLAEQRYSALREIVSLMRRDLYALMEYGQNIAPSSSHWGTIIEAHESSARLLRRKLAFRELEELRISIQSLINQARNHIEELSSVNMSTNAAHIEQHKQSQKTDSPDSECLEANSSCESITDTGTSEKSGPITKPSQGSEHGAVPIRVLIDCCPTLRSFQECELRTWSDFLEAVDRIRPSMGISSLTWDYAKDAMGFGQACVVLAAMLERFDAIRSPGAYLRFLAKKCVDGKFSSHQMIATLVGKRHAT